VPAVTCSEPWARSTRTSCYSTIDDQRIVLLLDRDADAFLAESAEADAHLVKPLDSLGLQHVVAELLAPT